MLIIISSYLRIASYTHIDTALSDNGIARIASKLYSSCITLSNFSIIYNGAIYIIFTVCADT